MKIKLDPGAIMPTRAHLVIMPIIRPTLEVVDSLEETERGAGGFGSSGR